VRRYAAHRHTMCGAAQARQRRTADIRRSLLVKLRTFLKIFVSCLLSIIAEFWVNIPGIVVLVTAF